MQQLCRRVNHESGAPDILICNAGRGIHERLAEGDPVKWFHVVNANRMISLGVLRGLLPGMLEKGRGDMVMIFGSSP